VIDYFCTLETAIPAAGVSSMTVAQGTNSLNHLLLTAKVKTRLWRFSPWLF